MINRGENLDPESMFVFLVWIGNNKQKNIMSTIVRTVLYIDLLIVLQCAEYNYFDFYVGFEIRVSSENINKF